jgi:hypothetical protein
VGDPAVTSPAVRYTPDSASVVATAPPCEWPMKVTESPGFTPARRMACVVATTDSAMFPATNLRFDSRSNGVVPDPTPHSWVPAMNTSA